MADDSFELNITLGDSSFAASGDADRVMKAFAEFKALTPARPPQPARTPARDRPEPDGTPSAHAAASSSGEKVPFAVFMKRNWQNQAAFGTAIFTWAKRYDGKEKMKPGEMETYWKKVAKKPGNPTQVCINAEKQGWLENQGGGYYAVFGHGEQMVDGTPTLTESQS